MDLVKDVEKLNESLDSVIKRVKNEKKLLSTYKFHLIEICKIFSPKERLQSLSFYSLYMLYHKYWEKSKVINSEWKNLKEKLQELHFELIKDVEASLIFYPICDACMVKHNNPYTSTDIFTLW